MTTRTAPLQGMAKPVGQNGLKLDLKAWTPMLKVPRRYTMDRFDHLIAKNPGASREAFLEQSRCLAFNDFPGHSFSLDVIGTVDRLLEIETAWVAGLETSELDTLFWQACYERHHDSLSFPAREKYLFLLADTEVTKLEKAAESRMNAKAEKAKTALHQAETDIENTLLDSMNEVGLESSLHNELEEALMADPACYDPNDPRNAPTPIHPTSTLLAPAPIPKPTAAGFRRPGAAARIKKMTVKEYIRDHTDGEGNKKRSPDSKHQPAPKRSRFDYVRNPLTDKTNIEDPFIKTDDVQDPFIRLLLNRSHQGPGGTTGSGNKPKRFSVDGTRLDRPLSRAVQRMTARPEVVTRPPRPFVQRMQDLNIAEIYKEEEEEEEEEL
ncbi:MAG: hypothetical protein M1812_006471 [Candelaria pacifica]|nr:MAG: hypothetical protein M1812_006471 [Candelaria pacifica]